MNADLGLYIAFWFIGLQSIVVFLSIDMALPKKRGPTLNNWAGYTFFGQRAKWHTWLAVTGLLLRSFLVVGAFVVVTVMNFAGRGIDHHVPARFGMVGFAPPGVKYINTVFRQSSGSVGKDVMVYNPTPREDVCPTSECGFEIRKAYTA